MIRLLVATFSIICCGVAKAADVVELSTMHYRGIGDFDGRERTFDIRAFKPEGVSSLPVFVFLAGTFDTFASNIYVELAKTMASKGLLSVLVDYANQGFCMDVCEDSGECDKDAMLVDLPTKTTYEKARSTIKALDVICAHEDADCSKGLGMSGHSQGSFTTLVLTTLDKRITAIAPMGVGYIQVWESLYTFNMSCILNDVMEKRLPKSKRRYVNGEKDELNDGSAPGDLQALVDFAGVKCAGDKGPVNCLDAQTGAGYYIVGQSEYTPEDKAMLQGIELAGHDFYANMDPVQMNAKFLPSYENGNKSWELHGHLDWLATALRTDLGSGSRTLIV